MAENELRAATIRDILAGLAKVEADVRNVVSQRAPYAPLVEIAGLKGMLDAYQGLRQDLTMQLDQLAAAKSNARDAEGSKLWSADAADDLPPLSPLESRQ